MKRRRTRRRTWRRTRRRCGGLGGIGGIRSGNRIVPTWKATSGGGGIGSSISETQTAAAGRIVMEASTKIGTSMHEGQQQRRRSCRGGQKSGGVDDDISVGHRTEDGFEGEETCEQACEEDEEESE